MPSQCSLPRGLLVILLHAMVDLPRRLALLPTDLCFWTVLLPPTPALPLQVRPKVPHGSPRAATRQGRAPARDNSGDDGDGESGGGLGGVLALWPVAVVAVTLVAMAFAKPAK